MNSIYYCGFNAIGGEINALSVVVTTRDHAEFLEECLLSVEREFPTNINIFIVDVGSRDRSLELIARFISKSKHKIIFTEIPRKFTPLEVFQSLVDVIDSVYISVISGDDYFLPGYGGCCLRLIENREPNTVINFAHQIVNSKSKFLGIRTPKWESIYKKDRRRLLYSNPGTTAGCILPWKILLENCLQEKNYNTMIEDYFFYIKMLEKVKFLGIRTPLVAYRQHEFNLSNSVYDSRYIRSLGSSVRLSWNLATGPIEKMFSVFLLLRWVRHVPFSQVVNYFRGFSKQTIGI